MIMVQEQLWPKRYIIDFLNYKILDPLNISHNCFGWRTWVEESRSRNFPVRNRNRTHQNMPILAVSTVKDVLRKLVQERPESWDTKISKTLRFVNTARQGSLTVSLLYLLHRFEPRVRGKGKFGMVLEEISRLKQLYMLHDIRVEAKQVLEIALQKQKPRYNVGREAHRFNEDDLVWLDAKPPGAFEHRQRPTVFSITKINQNETVDFISMSEDQRRMAHVTQLRLFKDNTTLGATKERSMTCPKTNVAGESSDSEDSEANVEPKNVNYMQPQERHASPPRTRRGRQVKTQGWMADYEKFFDLE